MQTRKPLRLQSYDYSQNGIYFVTVCTREKLHTLGRMVGAGVPTGPHTALTEYGQIVESCIRRMPTVEKYVIMPNHIHLLVRLTEDGTVRTPSPTQTPDKGKGLPMVIRWLKRETTRRCGRPLWQRGYYDHVIRNEADYLACWNYIDTNPARWGEDAYA